ncbi:MAG: GntR family transcriptional regulator [Alsobacter sp.]
MDAVVGLLRAERHAEMHAAIDPIERPRSLTETVTERLRALIVSGELALGQILSERQLGDALGVSKTPVREALAQLRVEGLVRIIPQKGAMVFTLSAREVVEICELRQTLEAAALKHAFERNRATLVQGLVAATERMRAARGRGDVRDYLAADTAFHQVFFATCGNGLLAEVYNLYNGKIAALRTHLAGKPQHTEKSFEEHLLMVEALDKGEIRSAEKILDKHIDRTRTTYSSEIEDIAAADRS